MTNNGIEQQKVLKALAREIKFESVMFADVFGHSTREPLRYYLWMCELNRWLSDKKCLSAFTLLNTVTDESLQSTLIAIIKHGQDNNKLPKKEKK
jgi:hypothetical protein